MYIDIIHIESDIQKQWKNILPAIFLNYLPDLFACVVDVDVVDSLLTPVVASLCVSSLHISTELKTSINTLGFVPE